MVNPKIKPAAHDLLVKCYKKLREDRTSDRGAAGVTVRQLESLVRLSEAVARVHLDSEVKAEYVKEAFRLQMDTLRRAERENIDLTPDIGEAEPGPPVENAVADGADGPAAEGPARGSLRKMRITYGEYQRMGQMLARYLAQQEEDGNIISEEDLIGWFMEQREAEIQTEAQLFEQQSLVQHVINRLVDKDRVLIVQRPSPDPINHPEKRALVKHPNFPVDELIGGRKL